MRLNKIKAEFVTFVPGQLAKGILYISKTYNSASHLCCCGCGRKVVTPVSPTGWVLEEHHGKVSLSPSIGNWAFPCQSHYWIRRNKVIWAGPMSRIDIEASYAQDRVYKEEFYGLRDSKQQPRPWWLKFLTWFS